MQSKMKVRSLILLFGLALLVTLPRAAGDTSDGHHGEEATADVSRTDADAHEKVRVHA